MRWWSTATVAIIGVLWNSYGTAQTLSHVDRSTPRDVQLQIARQAAPKEITDRATIYELGEHGYELAKRGDNGFSCLIEREKPDSMEPECYDAVGSKTTLAVRTFVEEQRSNGMNEEQIDRSIKQGYKSGKFQPPRKPGIVYMLSNYNYVFNPKTKTIIHFPGHLMFYAPYATEKTVGSGEGAPYVVHPGEPEAVMIVVPATPREK